MKNIADINETEYTPMNEEKREKLNALFKEREEARFGLAENQEMFMKRMELPTNKHRAEIREAVTSN